MKLWTSPTSPYARKVRIVLREKRIACDELAPSASGIDLAQKNPLAKVPTLELDDGTLLYDSVVIVEYLEALAPSPRMIPDEPVERALVRRWEALADGIADAVVIAMLEGRRAPERRDPAVVERQHGKVRAALSQIETALSARGGKLSTDFSLADAALVSALGYIELRAPELFKVPYPNLEGYRGLFATRSSVSTTEPPRSG
ncbi:MAG TPA: glutathione S-transferase N-terminal domain-containing protein [Polyangiaceae bacterium]|jgi:glutathione S-transferase|nr:glutathione S-transferase N-terminal domain-containing protein [Polyangiaceae bacterium]